MQIGIGLPNAVAGTTRDQLTDWARAAEEAGFSTLGTIDRIVFDSHEPIVALSAAAAVTDRIRLATDVMLGPLRQNPAVIAKQVLSLDALAGGGRAVLGIALGGREDDYEISGIDMSTRGRWLDAALPRIRAIFDGDGELESKLGPRPRGGGPTLLVGGSVQASFQRAAKYRGRLDTGRLRPGSVRGGCREPRGGVEAGRPRGKPFQDGPGLLLPRPRRQKNAEHDLGDYYAWLGDEVEQMIVGSAAKDADMVKQYTAAFETNGCDELIFFPSSSDPSQVGLLAEAVPL